MLKKITMLLLAAISATSYVQAQEQPCVTDEHYHLLTKKYPQLLEYEQQFEDQIAKKLGQKTSAVDTTMYDLPIVVHVVHDYGAENLSDNDIFEAAAYWAKVYVKQNADTAGVIAPFIPYIGNARIRLHLATIDPSGKPTKGIDRINSYLTTNGGDQAKYNQWPQNKYVNIWLINTFGAAYSGAAAYAIPPAAVAFEPYYDGIISLYSYTNSTTKTIPHELGHVLNLAHTWGNNNNAGVSCGNDFVDDTPPTKGHLPSGCGGAAIYDTTCAAGYMKTYLSMSGLVDSVVDYPDTANAQNIMDYTYCDKMFTIGQGYRMRATLNSATAGRNNLVKAANLVATGALAPRPDLRPIAEFVMDRGSTSLGSLDKRNYFLTLNNTSQFVFHNRSWNDTISNIAWSFSNGASTPTSASTSIVTNSFSQPGWVTTTLIATSNAGSDTLINTHSVYVADTAAAGVLSYTQNFANASDLSNWPMFNYYNNQFKWEFYNGAGIGDNSCIRYRSYDTSARITGMAIGDHDDFFTPAFNLAGTTGTAYFNFFSAGAYTFRNITTNDPHVQDSLEIDASVNGGSSWTKIAGFRTTDLENNGSQASEFIPSSPSHWKARSIAIPAANLTGNTFFRFRFWPGNQGNNLYIDNMSVSPWPAGVSEVLTAAGSFDIYPNPTNKSCNLVIKSGISGLVDYFIKDVTGKVVLEQHKKYGASTTQQETIDRDLLPAAGIYFVSVTTDGVVTTKKLVIY